MATTKAKRDASRIKQLAETILSYADTAEGSALTAGDKDRIVEIAKLAGGMDASTGKRDTSTKKKRRSAAKKGKKRAGSGR